jgi:hypothetical protein
MADTVSTVNGDEIDKPNRPTNDVRLTISTAATNQRTEYRKRSLVHDFFTKAQRENISLCTICKADVKAADGNTSNLRNHLRNKHRKQFDSLVADEEMITKKAKQACGTRRTLLDFDKKAGAQWDSSNPRAAAITKKLADMVCRDLQPYSIVLDKGFHDLVQELEPRYVLPTRKQLSKVRLVNCR